MCPNTDSVYEYEGFGGCESRCRIRIFRPPDGPPVVIATEAAGTNPGTSITNMTAEIATDVTRIHHLAGEPFVWIEHYDDRGDPAVRRNAFGRENGESSGASAPDSRIRNRRA